MAAKTKFLDRVLDHLERLDPKGIEAVVQRFARETELLETLFNLMEDGALVVDEKGRITYFNMAAARLTGFQASNLEGQDIDRVFPHADWKALSESREGSGGRIIHREFEVSFPRPRFLRFHAARLESESDRFRGFALIIHDATEARNRTLEAVELERSQALELFAASVAHEIGNPLNAIDLRMQLMERDLLKMRRAFADHGAIEAVDGESSERRPMTVLERVERLEESVRVAKSEILRLDHFITEFLQALRPSQPKWAEGSLNGVARSAVEVLLPEVENRGQKLRLQLEPQLPESIFDAGQIQQALVNLMKNAMQATSKGGTLTVSTASRSEGIWIEVADTGTGIPPEQLNRLFEPFYTTKKSGTGIGLMLVQRIVRAHSGRIDVDSVLGEGSRFRLWLPFDSPKPRLLESDTEP